MNKRHLLIVGGTRGLGRVLADVAADRYDRISVIARTSWGRGASSSSAPTVELYEADLECRSAVSGAMTRVIDQGGPLDSLAFTQRYRGGTDAGEWRTSVTATREIIELFAELSESVPQRAIVVMNSIAAHEVADEQPLDYHLAKAALEQMVRYYAVNLGPRGIRVNGVTTGPYVKPESEKEYRANVPLVELHSLISPMGRLPTAEEICRVFLFLLEDASAFINGQHLVVDGGVSLRGHEALARRIAKGLKNDDDS